MDTFGWLGLAIYLIIATGVLITNTRPNAQQSAVQKFELNVGLPLPAHLAEPMRGRMLSRRRLSTIGGMVGAITSAVVSLLSPATSPEGALSPLIIVAGVFAGWAIGTSVSAFRTSARGTNPDQVRYARAQAVTLGDYISRPELWLAWGPVALAVVAGVAIAMLAHAGVLHYNGTAALISSMVLSAVAVGTLVVFEVMGRRLVAMGNHVESAEDLVWEDAIRALTISELAGAPTFLGYYALLMAASPLLLTPDDGARAGFALISVGIAIVTVVIAVGMLVSALGVKRHFLRRLWPELASGPRP